MLEKASPLKQIGGIGGAKSIQADIDALESGSPTLRNLQKLVLFSGENRIPVENTADEDDVADATRIWEEERLFERVFEGLMRILTPKQVSALCCPDYSLLLSRCADDASRKTCSNKHQDYSGRWSSLSGPCLRTKKRV